MKPNLVIDAEKNWPRTLRAYAAIHCLWFVLYAFLGKGFAYTGWGPLYVGELLLIVGTIALITTRRTADLVLNPVGIVMCFFLAWQAACALPYLDTYGVETLRDSVLWAYAAFAWIAAALVLRLPRSLPTILARYKKFAGAYLILGPAAWLATLYLGDLLPAWPGSKVTIPLIKGDEYGVHLAGIFAFTLQGMAGPSWWALVILVDAMLGMSVRSGLVAFVCGGGLVLAFRPRIGRVMLGVVVGVGLILAMDAFDLRLRPPGASREFSVELLTRSLLSVVSDSERTDLESTKGWRLTWWNLIKEYTVEGPYFWTGKGYGINLADADGFQVGNREEPLRSPHSSHLNFLARSGVPGFLLWVTLQMTWLVTMASAYIKARRIRAPVWPELFAWITCYWAAFMAAAAFDVFLEGPMAGIPFWTIFGVGWASQLHFNSQMAIAKKQAMGALA